MQTSDEITQSWSARKISVVFIFLSIAVFVWKFIVHRRKYSNLPGPPHSFLFGHLPVMVKMMKKYPTDLHPQVVMTLITREYNLTGFWYLDTWPISSPIVIVIDPMVAAQITQKSVLPKSAHIMKSASHLLGKRSIVSANGGDWKSLRTMFNPGFSSSHLIATAVPGMVDDIGIFVQKLSSYADSGEIVCMFKPAMLLAIDMIGRVVMDTDFNSQRDENLLVNAFANQVLWTPGAPSVSLNPFILLNPVYKYMNWKYERQMYSFLEDYLERRFSSSSNNEKQKLGRKLRVIDIALEMYAGEKMGRSIFDKEFRKTAMDNIRTFIFAGHDTVSSTICHIYQLLSEHPNFVIRLKAEYDNTFGSDLTQTSQILKRNPNKLSELPLTTAVIKEALRLNPPASSVRSGDPKIQITYNGKIYDTVGPEIWICSHTIQRSANSYPSPDSFDPDRFLPPNTSPPDAFRPFERGPRNCIGLDMAMMELKLIMVLTLREFKFDLAYEDLNAIKGDREHGQKVDGFGGWGYQTLLLNARPKGEMPMRISRRITSSS